MAFPKVPLCGGWDDLIFWNPNLLGERARNDPRLLEFAARMRERRAGDS